jgi:hypothetical protein
MKFLQDYQEKKQTELFEAQGVFFAFSKSQYDEGKEKVGASKVNKIRSIGQGMFCLSKNADIVIESLYNIYDESIDQDVKENGIYGVITRELDNHEYCITLDIEDTVRALSDYKEITEDMILETSRSESYRDRIRKYK